MSFVEHLIEEVKKYPCLWKKSVEEYRNQNMRDNAWDMISGELNEPVENLKGEWKKLQDSHRQAMLRRKTKSGQGAKKMKAWKYEELMSFLLPDLSARETQSNIDIVEEVGECEDSLRLTMSGENEDEEEEEQTESLERRENGASNSRRGLHKLNTSTCKERDVDRVLKFVKQKQKRNQPGELDYFFASACKSTKRLPRRLQLKVKQEVMKAIVNAEMECLDSETSVTSPTPSPSLSCQSQLSPACSHTSSEVYASTVNYKSQGQALNCADVSAGNNECSFLFNL